MTIEMDFMQSSHLDPALVDPATSSLPGEKLVGRWINTNYETRGVAECVIQKEGEQFLVSITGVGEDAGIAWPTPKVRAVANLEEEAGQRSVALAADFDFGFMKSQTCIRVNKGVLVIVLFNTFQDDSGRANYLNREFFFRKD